MMGVSENSSVSIDMISWFDFTSLHSMAKETHLCVFLSLLSVTPLVFFLLRSIEAAMQHPLYLL